MSADSEATGSRARTRNSPSRANGVLRYAGLYLRDRHVPAAFGAMLAAVAVTAGLYVLDGGMDTTLGLLALAIGAGAAATSFATTDVALERTAAIALPPRRAAHVLVTGGVLVGLVVGLRAVGMPLLPVGVVLRDGLGLMGLAALGVTVLGGQLGWSLPVGWAAGALLTGPVSGAALRTVLTWPMQPVGTTGAVTSAVGLGVAGLVGYAAFGCRR